MKIARSGIALMVLALAGCLSGGGDSSDTATVPTPTPTAEGFWNFTFPSGVLGKVAILEDGTTWGVYTSGNAIVGALNGQTTYAGTSLTISGNQFNLASRTVLNVTSTGTFSPNSSISLTAPAGAASTATYGTHYDEPALLTSLTGAFSGAGMTTNSQWSATSVEISSLGVVTSTATNCSINGSVSPRASGKNIFDVSIKFTGDGCALGNDTTTTGITYYDVSNRAVWVMALNSAKTDGFIYIGKKP